MASGVPTGLRTVPANRKNVCDYQSSSHMDIQHHEYANIGTGDIGTNIELLRFSSLEWKD